MQTTTNAATEFDLVSLLWGEQTTPNHPVIERVNEFTGLVSYFCGEAAMTAYHNHEPFGGNWKYAVGRRGMASRMFVGETAFTDAMAHLIGIGNR